MTKRTQSNKTTIKTKKQKILYFMGYRLWIRSWTKVKTILPLILPPSLLYFTKRDRRDDIRRGKDTQHSAQESKIYWTSTDDASHAPVPSRHCGCSFTKRDRCNDIRRGKDTRYCDHESYELTLSFLTQRRRSYSYTLCRGRDTRYWAQEPSSSYQRCIPRPCKPVTSVSPLRSEIDAAI